jgi:hypothetical protein
MNKIKQGSSVYEFINLSAFTFRFISIDIKKWKKTDIFNLQKNDKLVKLKLIIISESSRKN